MNQHLAEHLVDHILVVAYQAAQHYSPSSLHLIEVAAAVALAECNLQCNQTGLDLVDKCYKGPP